MALPASPPMSFSQIKAEFAGPDNFSAYYRGGSYVPVHSGTASIPASGSMSFSHFLGAYAAAPYTFTGGARNDSRTDATAPLVRFVDDGTSTKSLSVALSNWCTPTTSNVGAGYEIQFTHVGGVYTYTGDALDSWHNLGSGVRLCSIAAASSGQSRSGSFNYTIRAAGGGATVATGTISLVSDRT